ncbi:TetR/AcrR family transcriptional regulator [Sphaerisporangium dianthi]|uniref:TetR/AcrR family transcriptional regulator n=1 Tax=Sphaerisporangium dianthi TaxID=1436120 RepID=A0ABV9CPA9_9ACTN
MLTRKGAATRARIIEATAELVAAKGAADTCLDDIRAATSTSKSQLFHYFPDGKAELLLAVAHDQARKVLDDQRPLLDNLDTWEAWEQWGALILAIYTPKLEYCPLTALTSQFSRKDPRIRTLITDLFDQWRDHLARGLRTMRAAGLLAADADPDTLALAVLASLQGGVIMGQTTGSVIPLEVAIEAALHHLRTYAATASSPAA